MLLSHPRSSYIDFVFALGIQIVKTPFLRVPPQIEQVVLGGILVSVQGIDKLVVFVIIQRKLVNERKCLRDWLLISFCE